MIDSKKNLYEIFFKRLLDLIVSLIGVVVLLPLFIIIIILILIDDPGTVFFSQKRIKKDKLFFTLHKFRSMKMSTPSDMPTHLLKNPEQHITRVGKVLRRTSLDELPQIFDIIIGNMSIVGPRPALWNQDDLIEERDKYDANSVMPGLTGLAQISGRDELIISDKAKIDGEYVSNLRKDSFTAFKQDLYCFFKTIYSVIKSDGVKEGGTGGR